MSMRVIYGASPADIAGFDTKRLRAEFLVEGLFRPGDMDFAYTHIDRMIVGAAMPTGAPLTFGDGAEVGTPLFFTAREMGIANLGGPGRATVDGAAFALGNRDILYVGRGAREVTLESADAARPARFYMNSVPAGRDIPHRLISREEAKPVDLGETARSNQRRLRMYIHPEVAPSCLLLMGITDLAPGSVWNTMPPHLHERRMEAYCYFDLAPEDRVIHLMGRPDETRSLIAAGGDVVLSPAWSIHMGAGTGPYAFVWGMTGENQAYTDVNPVAVADLK
ncbi:5-dehydro-4-deoxy-D-glucuronate isomerase [Pleomorphomonas carboxyditropha]|uniref:4-deoxy-L-threo-5-hexosulose-uronate ketol-isomerase n=1 Tax=Pleomorphomonas carboxyditropha TaxID=2023338 RepID=A0A2G9WTM2_9HYPH|nr:5-dehydro-4-deoxy-D-glucuronate isomerase [Pleomorphomonas carboxyditropha]PIO98035.1 5-dehydro-4-deoxy-D-glucuronate isomerase [Pleomorphomonas carboxyditropha]